MADIEKKPVVRKPRVVKADGAVEAPKAPRVRAAKAAAAAVDETVTSDGRYTYAIGRRKTSIAQVRYFAGGSGKVTVNGRDYAAYFPHFDLQESIRGPLKAVGKLDAVDIIASVRGGGIRGQADAIRLGIARALLAQDAAFRPALKAQDYLRRDPRKKERKKYGLKKARRAPQWAKR